MPGTSICILNANSYVSMRAGQVALFEMILLIICVVQCNRIKPGLEQKSCAYLQPTAFARCRDDAEAGRAVNIAG